MSERVRITDVSPRDGLQNEPGVIPTAEKARLVELLCATGVDEVEVTSFVSPRWVPQLGDAGELLKQVAELVRKRPLLSALVPNEKGLQSALEANASAGGSLIGKVSVFTAASETFNHRNTNATIAQSIERFGPVVHGAHGAGLLVRGYISCVIACPFEGAIPPAAVAKVAAALQSIGVDEIDLGDTIGAGTPRTTVDMLAAVASASTTPVTLHLHDTFNRAAVCVRAALDAGVRSFDGSAAGLGGCPYASKGGSRAPGNIATDLLVRTVQTAGFETGVNLEALEAAADFARTIVSRARSEAAP